MNKIKHSFNLIGFLFKTLWQELRSKRNWIIIAFIVWSYMIAWFNSNYEVRVMWKFGIYPRSTPIKKVSVVTVQATKEITLTPMPLTEEQIVKKSKWGSELWNIYMLESTRGKNDGCRKSGEFGGFGVMSVGSPACYATFELAVERANYWYEKIRKDNDLDTTLCIWNQGIKQPQCRYSQTYHTL